MTVTILGAPASQPTRSLEWLCSLTGIPYNSKLVRLDKGQHKTAEYKKLNPNGKIPTMDDDGFILYESVAIARYLIQKYQSELNIPDHYLPQDLQTNGKINSYLDWHHTTFRPGIATYAFKAVIAPISFNMKFTSEETEAARVNAIKTLKSFNDQWLSQNDRFIAGTNKPSIADIFAYGELAQLLVVFKEQKVSEWEQVKELPNVRTWAAKMESLPHFDKIHAGIYKFKQAVQNKQSKL